MRRLWPRFSIREVLGATAMLGVGFTWPILFFFIAPLLGAGILARMGYGSTAPVVAGVALSAAFGPAVSYYYWNYPFRPPALLPELRSIKTLHQLSSFNGLDEIGGVSANGMTTIPPAAALHWNTPGGLMPTDRILQEFGQRNLRINSPTPLSADMLASIWKAADAAGLLLDGCPDRLNTKTLDGYAGAAQLLDGTEITFAAMMGDEYSNDHYPYYEVVFSQRPGGLNVVNSLWFFEDIAGLEGMNFFLVSLPAFVVILPVTFVTWSVVAERLAMARAAAGALPCGGPTGRG